MLMRACLHTMVMFVNNNTDDEVVHLKEMAKYDVIRPAVVSLRAGELQCCCIIPFFICTPHPTTLLKETGFLRVRGEVFKAISTG